MYGLNMDTQNTEKIKQVFGELEPSWQSTRGPIQVAISKLPRPEEDNGYFQLARVAGLTA